MLDLVKITWFTWIWKLYIQPQSSLNEPWKYIGYFDYRWCVSLKIALEFENDNFFQEIAIELFKFPLGKLSLALLFLDVLSNRYQ